MWFLLTSIPRIVVYLDLQYIPRNIAFTFFSACISISICCCACAWLSEASECRGGGASEFVAHIDVEFRLRECCESV